LALTRNVAASEEIAQEVFVSAWHGLGELQQPSSFVPWLRQLVRRRAADFQRGRYRDNGRTAGGDEALAQVADPGATADKKLLWAEEHVALEEALDALASEDRELLLLFYREGRSAKEVAALVGISTAAAHKRIERAREKVRADVLERLSDAAVRTAPRADFASSVVALLPGAGTAAKIATSGLAGAQAAPVVTKVGVGAKVAAFALWIAQPVAMVVWADRYVARELAGPSGEPKRELLRFRLMYGAFTLFWILLPSLISSYAPFASAPKPVRVLLLLALFAVSMVSIRSLQPRLLRVVAPEPAAREQAARRSVAGRQKMIPYGPSFLAILLLGNTLHDADVQRALHHPHGALVLLPLVAGILIFVPVQQWGIRWLQGRLSARAWVTASLAVMAAVCVAELLVFSEVFGSCTSALGG
jgi:RNA polymerase sigma factor (sigma-70 family)